jgi:GDP-mannose 6-dehydrogenase
VIPTVERASGKSIGTGFGVCVNPEFMREGTAVTDFLQPSITVIGASDSAHSQMLRELYEWAPGRIFETTFRSAEMVKYVCNAWHATKVTFSNEIGTLPKELGVDAESVVDIWRTQSSIFLPATSNRASLSVVRAYPRMCEP